MLDQEEEWIRAWSDLYELAGERHDVVYLTPEFEEMARKQALGWLQETAYAGSQVAVGELWYWGRKAIQVCRVES